MTTQRTETQSTGTPSTGTLPSTASSVARRQALLDCYSVAGSPMATVYLPTISTNTAAEDRFEIQRKNVASQLTEDGATQALVEHVGNALGRHSHDDGDALLVVCTEDSVLLDHVMDRPVDRLITAVAPTPLLLPMLAANQVDERHLAVLLDRTGADVYLRTGVGAPIDSMDVDGDAVRIHRGHPGGWSQKRFQQTAENGWESNAKDVIDALTDEYGLDQPLIVAGDERAVGFFMEHLPTATDAVVIDGSRHADHAAFLDATDEVMRTRAAARIVETLDTFRSLLSAEKAATGQIVLDLLSRGQVDHLLVANDSLDAARTTARIDFTVPMHRLDDDHGAATIAPMTDAAVALAEATGANVTVVPASLPDLELGLGAILRF